MVLRIFLVACFGIVLPIMYFALRHYGKPNGQQVFGVTIGSHHFNEEEIMMVQRQYIKEINWCGLVSLITLIGSSFIPYESICYTVLTVWMLTVCVVFEFPFAKANSKVKQLKAERGWNGEFKRTVVVDTEVAKLQDTLLFKGWYAIAFVVSTLPTLGYLLYGIRGEIKWEIALVLALLSIAGIIMALTGILVQKVRFKEYTANSEINQAVARTKRYHLAKGMAGVALATAGYTVFLSAECCTSITNTLAIIIVSILYTIFVLCYLCYIFFMAYRVKLKLVGEEETVVTDDDEYWIHGIFYYNKNDTHFMVEKRVGIGTTVNMARPAAKVCAVILVLLLLPLPLISVWTIGDEFSDMELIVTEQGVEVKQFEGNYKVPYGEIKEAEIITDYGRASKLIGTNLDNLYRGKFTIGDYGICKVCFNPNNKLFLVIKTEDTTYIMSDETDAGTQEAYDKLLLKLKKL